MTSINTNRAAMTALASLNMTQKRLDSTQEHISTGLRVNSATDNAAYWSIATTMKSDNSALSTIKDALGLASATIDVTYTALNSEVTTVQKIKDKLVAAAAPGVDKAKIQTEIAALQGQLKSTADSANFSGENWLSVDSSAPGYNASKSILSSFSRSTAGVSIQTISFDGDTTKLFDANDKSGILDKEDTTTNGGVAYSTATLDISAMSTSPNDTADLKQMISYVDASLTKLTNAAANVGALKTRVDAQSNFVTTLMDAVTRGVGSLVDADMSEESTKLQALQVQQQLGTQALSIANQSSQAILKLFQG
ncbi:flagellin [Aestuariivirga litoralis]|uniref:flagellin N-terminal helical domain-containing protein n=1 Tax=Aestuariivirga litoralis TaxID=2650924 RepID=UPI0018C81E56|nr:flagellin [Aestuariivirga litoralis]MBG1233188.1 flagellin [Aestuariivirga litoralis]